MKYQLEDRVLLCHQGSGYTTLYCQMYILFKIERRLKIKLIKKELLLIERWEKVYISLTKEY